MSIKDLLVSSLKDKVVLITVLLLAFFIVFGFHTTYTLIKLNIEVEQAFESSKGRTNAILRANSSVNNMESELLRLIAVSNKKDIRASAIASIRASSLLDEAIQNLQSQLPDNKSVNQLAKLLNQIKPNRMAIISYARKNDDQKAFSVVNEIIPYTFDISKYLKMLIKEDQEYINNLFITFKESEINTLLSASVIITITILLLIIINTRLQKTKVELKNLNHSLEDKVVERTKQLNKSYLEIQNALSKLKQSTQDLDREKQFVVSVMDSQNNIVITLEQQAIKSVNKAFFDFFGVNNLQEFKQKIARSISDLFTSNGSDCIQASMDNKNWVEYVHNRQGEINKAVMEIDGSDYVFNISVDKFKFQDEELYTVVLTDITELERIRNKIELINKNTKDSIKYASLIQNSIIPSKSSFYEFFSDAFVFWQPKDIVGGDVYIFDVLKNKTECISMTIDCTGHGVPGAFVTMLVKAIERQIIANISLEDKEVEVSMIFTFFNKELKKILKQEKNSKAPSNVGFDGGILYYHKTKGVVKYVGANTPLFYMEDDEMKIIKGDKQSIGYKSSDINYKFTEHTINVKKGMIFYITSDGYLDQNGGEKLFPFGKRKFKSIIMNNYHKPLDVQKEIFVREMIEYKGVEDQTDDITLLALKI
jgi:serine phosphatase RsbU (regulator of sigma subunit)